MKKLLSILGALGLVATASTSVVACSKTVNEQIDEVLQGQNFQVLNQFNKDSIGKSVQEVLHITPDEFFYSKGLNNDNKYIGNRNTTIDGSFGASKWAFIDMLNSKFNLGLSEDAKVDFAKPDFSNPSLKLTQGDLLSHIKYNVNNFDELSKIKVKNVTGSYQEGGKSPNIDDTASKLSLDAWTKIINIGNPNFYKKYEDQIAFLDSDEFVDRTYTRNVTFEYGDDTAKKDFTFTQLIQIQNTESIKDVKNNSYWFKDTVAPQLEAIYNKYINKDNDPDGKLWGTLDLNTFMSMALARMNIFTIKKQDYCVSVELDTNNIKDQINSVLKNPEQLINDFINKNNEKVIADAFALAKKNDDKKTVFADDGGNDNAGDDPSKKVDISTLPWDTFINPRVGQTGKYLNSDYLSLVVAWIAKSSSAKDITNKDIELLDGTGNPIADDAKVTDDFKLTIKAAGDSQYLTGKKENIELDTNTINKFISELPPVKDDIKEQLLFGAMENSALQKNDFLFKTFGAKTPEYFDSHWIEKGTSYQEMSPAVIEENKPVTEANFDKTLSDIENKLNNTTFNVDSNVYDDSSVKWTTNITDDEYKPGTSGFTTSDINLYNE